MRNFSAIGLFLSALVVSGGAYAADAVVETAPEAVLADPGFSWTGFYAGVNAGYGFVAIDRVGVRVDGDYLGHIGTLEQSGFLGGAQIGYNYQMNQFVLGIEADSRVPDSMIQHPETLKASMSMPNPASTGSARFVPASVMHGIAP